MWVAQLMCGLVSEGVDPHHSALLYHLRLLARRGPDGRLETTDVQISTGTAGKVRPPYRADPDEEDEADECYETPPKDRVVSDADAARVEGGWVSVLQWLDHEELTAAGEWEARAGSGRADQADFLRAQV